MKSRIGSTRQDDVTVFICSECGRPNVFDMRIKPKPNSAIMAFMALIVFGSFVAVGFLAGVLCR